MRPTYVGAIAGGMSGAVMAYSVMWSACVTINFATALIATRGPDERAHAINALMGVCLSTIAQNRVMLMTAGTTALVGAGLGCCTAKIVESAYNIMNNR